MTNKVIMLFAVIATAFVLVSCDMAPMPTGYWYIQNALDEDITITTVFKEDGSNSCVVHPDEIRLETVHYIVSQKGHDGVYGWAIDSHKARIDKVIITYKGVDYVETSSEGKSIINLGSYVFFPVNDNTGDQKFLFVIDEEYLNSLTVEDSEE